ncbi:DNA mismatch repair protein MutS [bacterium]|nr:DNA mismatch repair protein MutS [bacterium]|tara:strand:+ start:3091 stop:3348 length:258 start_codon:yes stop_codon:yes gene_type:complete
MAKSTLRLDLHPIANDGRAIDGALKALFIEVAQKRVKSAEIISGKGGGQLMKRVKRWLQQKHIKAQYKRIEVDTQNHGRLFVHFR